MAADDPPLWLTAEVVEHFVEHFRWDSEPHAAYQGSSAPDRLDLRQPCETGIIGASSNHDGPPRAAKASSIRRYMRPSTSPSTSLNPNFA
jgi:hypothetical protein